jgi:hypothetical protein
VSDWRARAFGHTYRGASDWSSGSDLGGEFGKWLIALEWRTPLTSEQMILKCD